MPPSTVSNGSIFGYAGITVLVFRNTLFSPFAEHYHKRLSAFRPRNQTSSWWRAVLIEMKHRYLKRADTWLGITCFAKGSSWGISIPYPVGDCPDAVCVKKRE